MSDLDFLGMQRVRPKRAALARSAARLTRLDLDIERSPDPLTVVRISRGWKPIGEDLAAARTISNAIDAQVPRVAEPRRGNFGLEILGTTLAGLAVGWTLPGFTDGGAGAKLAAGGAVAALAFSWGRILRRELGYVWARYREGRDGAADLNLALAGFNMSGALAPEAYHAAHFGLNRRIPRRLAQALVEGRAPGDLAPEDLDVRRPVAPDDVVLLVDHVMLKDDGDLILVSVLRMYRLAKPGGWRPRFRWPHAPADTRDLVPAH